MRHLFAALAAMALVGGFTLRAGAEETPPPQPPPKLEAVYLALTGVEATEVAAVAGALGAVPGVRSATWITPAREVKVVREEGKASIAQLSDAATHAGAATLGALPVASAGFVFLTKLHCKGCVATVNKALRAVAGTKDVTVSEDLTRVHVVYDPKLTNPKALEAALTACGKAAKAG